MFFLHLGFKKKNKIAWSWHYFLLNFYSLKAKDREEIGLVKQETSKSVESLWTRTFQQPKAVGDVLGPACGGSPADIWDIRRFLRCLRYPIMYQQASCGQAADP